MSKEFQVAETELKDGLSIIKASAGTGKTYNLTRLVLRFLLDGTAKKLEEILLVTYTRDAAGELSEKLRKIFEDLQLAENIEGIKDDKGLYELAEKFGFENVRQKAREALLDIDQLNASTIHSFCQRILKEEGELCGQPVVPEITTDTSKLLEDIAREYWEQRVAKDEMLAAIAFSVGWSFEKTLKSLAKVLRLSEFEPIPAVESLDECLKTLKNLRSQCTSEGVEKLREHARRVPQWNKDAGTEEDRAKAFATLEGGSLIDWIQTVKWLEALVRDKKGLINAQRKEAKKIIQEIAQLPIKRVIEDANKVLKLILWSFQIELIKYLRQEMVRRLEADRTVDYDTLVKKVRDALCDDSKGSAERLTQRLRSRFKVVLIDESQDTDATQFDIFRKIFLGVKKNESQSGRKMLLIGDPKQSIYGFRGADLNTYLSACEGIEEDRITTLSKTYRAPEKLVSCVNALFSRENAFHNEKIDFQPATSGLSKDIVLKDGDKEPSRVEVWVEEDAKPEAGKTTKRIVKRVSEEICWLLTTEATIRECGEERIVRPEDFAVLVFKHDQGIEMRDALLRLGVPAVMAATQDVMASDEAEELLRILHAINEPRNIEKRLAAMATRLLGKRAHEMGVLAEDDELVAKFTRWQELCAREGIAAALIEADREEGISVRLSKLEYGERRITNLRQLVELLQTEMLANNYKLEHLIAWFSSQIVEVSLRAQIEERQQQLESDSRAVKISTIHAAKGMEYPLVFCPFLWRTKAGGQDDLSVLSVSGEKAKLVNKALLDESHGEIQTKLSAADREERLRLAYVAMTRAQAKLWLYVGFPCDGEMDWLLQHQEGSEYRKLLKNLVQDKVEENDLTIESLESDKDCGKWVPEENTSGELEVLEFPKIPKTWGMTSFSQLTKEKHAKGGGDSFEQAEDEKAVFDDGENAFIHAPGSALVGTAIHDLIQHWDFGAVDQKVIREGLEKYALPPMKDPGVTWEGCVVSMFEELRGAELPGFGITIAEACKEAKASEWHFQLPLDELFNVRGLAGVFEKHGYGDYAKQLRDLPDEVLRGYLHGFLDRIAVDPQRDRWGVIDWKTNNLGAKAEDYQKHERLMACAMQAHYFLQLHLYLVALRRYLGKEKKELQAWLVFLRGVKRGTSHGILHVKPTEDMLDDLDALFHGGKL